MSIRKVILDKSILKSVNFKIALLEESIIPSHFFISKKTFELLQDKMEDERARSETKKVLEKMFNLILDVAEKNGGIKKLHNGGVSLDDILVNKGSKISIKKSEKEGSRYESINLHETLGKDNCFIYTRDATLILRASENQIETIRLKAFQIKKGFKSQSELSDKENLAITKEEAFLGLSENEFVLFGTKNYQYKSGKLIPINFDKTSNVEKIKAVNIDQKMMMHLVQDSTIPVVLLTGVAGVGKSFLALLEFYRGYKKGIYKKLFISRANVSFEDNGSKPGTEKEKVRGVLGPIKTTLEELATLMPGSDIFKKLLEDFNAKEGEEPHKMLNVTSFGEIQGKTFPKNSLAFLDEAQNATEQQIQSFFTRAGKEAKMIFAGDLGQVANPKLSIYNNGLLFLERNARNQSLVGVLYSTKASARSNIAQLGADIFS
ncbi:MAG: putative ribonuclease YlaK [Candidatus Paceibacteria bacterium]|jgi:predicted ribonuclease YlaK